MNFKFMCSFFVVVSAVISVLFISDTFAQHSPVPNIVDNIQRLSVVSTQLTNRSQGLDLSKFLEMSMLQWPQQLAQKRLEGQRLSSNNTTCAHDLLSWAEELDKKTMWALDSECALT